MARSAQTAMDRNRILMNLPDGAKRVQVMDAKGKTRYKKPSEVGAGDNIMFNTNGEPIVMCGSPGRKASTNTTVLKPLNDNIGEVVEAKNVHIANNELVSTLKKDPESDGVMDMVMWGLAEEAASLEFERGEAERHGKDTSSLSLRRANILRATGELFLKRREKMGTGSIDMETKAFETVFLFMLETFREAMEEAGVRPELIETAFAKVSKRLAGSWKQEANARMREIK